jgi:hypothetical protein
MGRQYFDDAPDVLAEDMAAVREALASAQSTVAQAQVTAAQFLIQNGHEVSAGHADTHGPGGGSPRS